MALQSHFSLTRVENRLEMEGRENLGNTAGLGTFPVPETFRIGIFFELEVLGVGILSDRGYLDRFLVNMTINYE